ncbi:hypothetical protein [Agromyces salentinus]|uniref:DUF3558 domain-containing protein n=1 Tax=Agromyces salentinus TaxID=269421 RepID=A0ABN2MKD9_9MICO|nr:hypothetical protein [Agromyces salentinus]
MTRGRHRSLLIAVLLAGGATLAGCSAAAPGDGEPSTASTSPSSSASATATATPAASEEPTTEPAAATCETVLTEEAYASLAADGLDPVELGESTFYPIADDLVAAGALACKWGKPSSDITMTVVQLSGIDVAASEWPAALAAEGYVETGDPVPGAYTGPPEPGTGMPSAVIVTPDRLTFISAPSHATDIAPAS